jgi:hypothetical protein
MSPTLMKTVTTFRLMLAILLLTAQWVQAQGPGDHWSFQPLDAVSPTRAVQPATARTAVDCFVQDELSVHQLSPAPRADRATWLRRVTCDLTGLPPRPEQMQAFLADTSPRAYPQVIDRLLASPAYGERWGKYWLDVVGYADSNGYFNADTDRPYAYHYRDYVIRSFNADTAYDVFVRQQLAGDELISQLANPSLEQVRKLMIATHFLRNAPDGSGESDGNPEEVTIDRATALEGSLQIVMNSLLGLTIQCARCHAHKFEPVSHAEYYRLQAVLYPAFPAFHNDRWVVPKQRIGGLAFAAQFARWKTRSAEIDARVAALEAEKKKAPGPSEEFDKQIEQAQAERPSQPGTVAWVTDVVAPAPDIFRLESGNYQSHAEVVQPGGLSILTAGDATFHPQPLSLPPSTVLAGFRPGSVEYAADQARSSTGRRLAFSGWITEPGSRAAGLLARVLVNRIWQYHFGTGLVVTPGNFGVSGSRPSHPELLEYLATYLVDHRWSIKSLHRLILNSAVYQQASALAVDNPDTQVALRVDPSNRLLWKYPLRRLNAEAIRDNLLAVSGELDQRMFGPYTPTQRTGSGDVTVSLEEPGARRRSIYLQQRRTQVNTFLELFDAPSMVNNCPQRSISTVPLQSLALLNSDFMLRRSSAFSGRLDRFPPAAGAERIAYSFQLLLGRSPTAVELDASLAFIHKQQRLQRDDNGRATRTWAEYCQMLLATNAFLYLE